MTKKNLIKNATIKKIQSKLFSKKTLANEIFKSLEEVFYKSSVNLYLLHSESTEIDITISNKKLWPIPKNEIHWLKSLTEKSDKNSNYEIVIPNGIYIKKRKYLSKLDIQQIIADKNKYSYNCSDGLYIKLENNQNELFGITFIHNWNSKETLTQAYKDLKERIEKTVIFFENIINNVENIFIHNKIKNLLSDKSKLKLKIQKDEEDLKRRLLELEAINNCTQNLNNSLFYKDSIKIIINSISKVIKYDICSIIITNFSVESEIFITLKKDVKENLLNTIINQSINFTIPFNTKSIKTDSIIHYVDNQFSTNQTIHKINSFTNIPLKFKNEMIGLMSLYSEKKDIFQTNEVSFLNTLSNQLSATLGKLHVIKKLEKSKISSLILNMAEPVIFYDNINHSEIYNESAKIEFNFSEEINIQNNNQSKNLLEILSMKYLYDQVKKNKTPIKNKLITINNKIFTVNISPVNHDEIHLGVILVFRDITEIQKTDRIKTQRLEAIEKVNQIIEHIQNLDELLSFLIDYLLDIAKAEMGSIQLIQNGIISTKVHSNFPDKISNHYKFKNSKTICETVMNEKQTIFIDNFFENPNTDPNVKILIDSYLSIPIMVNQEIIGIINIARKFGSTVEKLSEDDIKTLTTLTTLSGTAILNAIYYEEKQKNEKFEQEIEIAKTIQQNLLPQKIPQSDKFTFAAKTTSAHYIGGDYYEFIQLSREKIGIVIADIIGKGIPAGLHMATLKSILTNNLKKNYTPKQVLQKINNIVFNDPVIDKFTPMFYCIIDKKNMTFTYSNAGHEPGILFRNDKFILLDTIGFPIGAYKNTTYHEKTIDLKNEDLLIFYTDGIIETKNKANQIFGNRRLNNFIKKNKTKHPQSIISNLNNYLKTFSNNDEHSDDQTIIIAKVNFNVSNKTRSKLLKSKKIKVNCDKKNIRKIRNIIDELFKNQNSSESFIHDTKLAINEAHANIIEHSYGGYIDGEIIFKFMFYNDKIEITIRDLGKKFNILNSQKDSSYLPKLDGSGLGLHLINTLMDKVKYTQKTIGTELKLTKFKNLS